MSDQIKSVAFIEEHKLTDHVKLNEAHGFEIPADLYADVVLKQCDITPAQLKKKEKLDGEFLAAMVYVGGEAASTRMKENKDVTEIGMTFPMGNGVTGDVIFGREQKAVVHVNHKTATAEMKRVLVHVNTLFEQVNN